MKSNQPIPNSIENMENQEKYFNNCPNMILDELENTSSIIDHNIHSSHGLYKSYFGKTSNFIKKPKFNIYQAFFMLCLFTFVAVNSIFVLIVPHDEPAEIIDYVHNYLSSYNDILSQDQYKHIRIIIIYTTAIIQDSIFIYLCILWIIKGNSWRPVISFILLMITKLICNLTITFLPPKNLIFDETSFSFFTFLNVKEWNYFLCASISINLLCFNYLYEYKSVINKLISLISLINSLFQLGYFLILKSCYAFDAFTCLIIGQYFYYLAFYIDDYFE